MTGRRSPSPSAPDRAVTAAPLLGSAVALLGVVVLFSLLGGPRLRVASAGSPVTVGTLRLSVESAAWVGHDMASMGPMPMPGMPAPGSGRIHVKVLVDNAAAGRLSFKPGEFRLVSESARSWAPLRSTMPGSVVLAGGASVAGDLYFEVPDDQSSFTLTLAHGRERAVVPLSLPGAAHDHAESADR